MKALDAVYEAVGELEAAGVPSPRVDAEQLVAHVLGRTRTEVYADDGLLDEGQISRLRTLVERRRDREPLAYILGEWGFRHLTLAVDRRVLVPRPETEVVVERCLERVSGLTDPEVLEVGTGSGAIALAIAHEHPGARITAVDRSAEALEVAAANRDRVADDGRVRLVHGDLVAGVDGPFDLVVSNPPYVLPEEFDALQPEIRLHEPREALVGIGVGEAIAERAFEALAPGGWLVLECADDRAGHLAGELRALGYADVVTSLDLAGRERVVEGRLPG